MLLSQPPEGVTHPTTWSSASFALLISKFFPFFNAIFGLNFGKNSELVFAVS